MCETPRVKGLFGLLCIWAIAAAPLTSAAEPHYRYTVQYDPIVEKLKVKVCFSGTTPGQLVAYHRRAPRYLEQVTTQHSGDLRRPKQQGTRIKLDGLAPSSCVDYAVALADGAPRRFRGPITRRGQDLLLSPNSWLWYPGQSPSDAVTELIFELPPDLAISAPWPRQVRSGQRAIYRFGPRPHDWDSRMALGRFDVVEIAAPGATVELAILDASPPADYEALERWIRSGVQALTTLYGRFPVTSAQILVVPTGPGREPVPWGQVMRGGGDAVHLYVDQTRPLDEFLDDWTLVHELSHLLHPRLHGRDAWISEGLASYYQNVLRARAGLLSPAQAWERLHAGFQRGIRGTPQDQTLAEVTEHMMRDRRFMRVYWSGAAVALLADLELRRRTQGRQSLDTALEQLSACCLPSDRMWTGRELMERLDRLTETDVFTGLYLQHAHSRAFPVLDEAYEQLGLQVRRGALVLREDAAAAKLRQAIMAPTPEPR